jgi:hypothetical protein
VWKSITVRNVDVGFRLVPENKTEKERTVSGKNNKEGSIGSASFVDSSFSNVGTAVETRPLNSKPGTNSTGIVLENVAFSNVQKGVADTSGKTLLAGGSKTINEWAAGPIYAPDRRFSMGDDES